MLVLTERDVSAILTMEAGIERVEESFREYAQGRATLAPRMALPIGGEAGTFRVMAASVPSSGVFGLKTLTGVPGKRRAGVTYFAMLLFDATLGTLAAMIPATLITALRTGAAGGVAARYLARKDARVLGLIGAGVQGRAQVEAIRAVRPLDTVKIFDVHEPAARSLADDLTRSGMQARLVKSARECVQGSDIIISATTSSVPVVLGEWLEPGMHVSAIGANSPVKHELDAEAFARSRLVLDFREQVLLEAGDLIAARQCGAIVDRDLSLELGDVVAGQVPGRQSAQEITVFKSVGVAFQDVAVAGWIYREAQRRGLGSSIELEEPAHETV